MPSPSVSHGFVSAVLPKQVFPPLFNRYDPGMSFGPHLDNSIRQITGTPYRVRTDISVTLFLSQPDEYDGGELVIDDLYGSHAVKLPAGEMVLYPASSLHHVTSVTRGTRFASFFWIQSMVRDEHPRTLLFDFDMAINHQTSPAPSHLPLEQQLQSKLDLPRIVGSIASGTHFAEVRAGEIARTRNRLNSVAAEIRSVEVRVIENVEELSPELQVEAFAKLEVFEGGEIQPLERWSGDLGWGSTQQAEAAIDRNASRNRSGVGTG
jgi:hypothetical protein